MPDASRVVSVKGQLLSSWALAPSNPMAHKQTALGTGVPLAAPCSRGLCCRRNHFFHPVEMPWHVKPCPQHSAPMREGWCLQNVPGLQARVAEAWSQAREPPALAQLNSGGPEAQLQPGLLRAKTAS